MPTHNRAHLLGRAIESVLAQTHQEWELTVVDDGSRDKTPEVVAAFTDPRIRYVRNEIPKGPAGARNTGIRAASGNTPFLAFLDDDDEWLPTKLERQLELFRTGAASLVAVGCGRIDYDDKTEQAHLPAHRGSVFEHLLARRARGYGAQLIMVRRLPGEADMLFDSGLQPLEDLDYSIRLSRRGTFDFVPEPLVRIFRDDGGEHVWNPETAVRGYRALAAKYATELKDRPDVLSFYDICIALDLGRLGRMDECRRHLRNAAAHSPARRSRLAAWYAASFLGPNGIRIASRLVPMAPPQPAPSAPVSRSSLPVRNSSLATFVWAAGQVDAETLTSIIAACAYSL